MAEGISRRKINMSQKSFSRFLSSNLRYKEDKLIYDNDYDRTMQKRL